MSTDFCRGVEEAVKFILIKRAAHCKKTVRCREKRRMTRENAGNYAAKRPPNMAMDERLAEAIRNKTVKGEIACAQAQIISKKLGATLEQVGAVIDLLEIRIKRCQIGLFGYPKEKFPEGRAVKAAESVTPDLEAAIRNNLVAGRLPCKLAWKIAADYRMPKMAVSSACEALKIKIKPCQLGSF